MNNDKRLVLHFLDVANAISLKDEESASLHQDIEFMSPSTTANLAIMAGILNRIRKEEKLKRSKPKNLGSAWGNQNERINIIG